MALIDDDTITLACPSCGKPITDKVRWFKQDGHVCPNGCGTVLKTDNFRQALEKADREVEDFKHSLEHRIHL